MVSDEKTVFRFSQLSLSTGQAALGFSAVGLVSLLVGGSGPATFGLFGAGVFWVVLHLSARVVVTQDTIEVMNWFRTRRFELGSSETEIWFPGEPSRRDNGRKAALRVRSAGGAWVESWAAIGGTLRSSQDGMNELRYRVERNSNGQVQITIGGDPPR